MNNQNQNNTPNHKKIAGICGLCALCLFLLGSTLFTRESEKVFVPEASNTSSSTDTWDENNNDAITTSSQSPESTPKPIQKTGAASDDTQVTVSDDANGTITNLTPENQKITQDKPSEPPKPIDEVTNPDKQPGYDSSVSQSEPPQNTPPSVNTDQNNAESHPGQVYDPVFGWVTPSTTQQDTIDSDGDINKQVGSMGGN